MNRDALIARKDVVRGEITQIVSRLEQARTALDTAAGTQRRFLTRRITFLEARVEALAAEESQLRMAIDRSR